MYLSLSFTANRELKKNSTGEMAQCSIFMQLSKEKEKKVNTMIFFFCLSIFITTLNNSSLYYSNTEYLKKHGEYVMININ